MFLIAYLISLVNMRREVYGFFLRKRLVALQRVEKERGF